MKMIRIIKVTSLLLVGLGLAVTSCKTELDNIPDDNDTNTGTGYITLGISTGTVPQAKYAPYASLPPLPAEEYIESVRMVLYDGNTPGSRVKYAIDFQIRTNEYYNSAVPDPGTFPWTDYSTGQKDLYIPDSGSELTTYARKVEKADYYMLIIINPNAQILSATAENQSLEQFIKSKELSPTLSDKAVGLINENGHFLMTNHQGLVKVRKEDLQDDEDSANKNPIDVKVEKAVARITLTNSVADYYTPVTDGRKVSDLTWDLDITNKRTYWMRRLALKEGGTQMEQQGDTDSDNFYAEDPNFTGFSGSGEPVDGQFFYYEQELENNGYTTGSLSFDNNENYDPANNDNAYCPENTMAADDQGENVVTRVLIRCTYLPAAIANAGGNGSYFVFVNRLISVPDMFEYIDDNTKIPANLIGLKEPLKRLMEEEPGIFDDISQTGSFEKYGIKYYHEGVNYYAIPVRHFDSAVKDEYGYYGVVRNHSYEVELTEIKGPGSPTVIIPDYDSPLEFKVKNWTVFDVDYNL